MKNNILFVFIINLFLFVNLANALNIAYNHLTGQIYELDNQDVDRFLGQIDTTTGTLRGTDLTVDINTVELPRLKFNTATKKVELRSQPEQDKIDNAKLIGKILALKKEVELLNIIASKENTVEILAEIQKSTDIMTIEINAIKTRIK